MVRPQVQQPTREFTAVIDEQIFGCLALRGKSIQYRYHMFAAEALTDFDGQCFATEDVHHGQRTKTCPVSELIRYEVQTPNIVRGTWSDPLPASRPPSCAASAASSAVVAVPPGRADTFDSCRTALHFGSGLREKGIRVIRPPPRSPNLNAYVERWVRSVGDECVSKVIPIGQRMLRGALREYVAHHQLECNHHGLSNALITPCALVEGQNRTIGCRSRLGGISITKKGLPYDARGDFEPNGIIWRPMWNTPVHRRRNPRPNISSGDSRKSR